MACYYFKMSVVLCSPSYIYGTCVEGTGGAGGRGAALASASRLFAAVRKTMRAQLLGLAFAVLAAVMSGRKLSQDGSQRWTR